MNTSVRLRRTSASRWGIAALATVLAAGVTALAALPAAPKKPSKLVLPARRLGALAPADHECNHFGPLSCPFATTEGALTTADCALNDGSRIDFFQFSGVAGQTVTIDLASIAFDAYLFLLDPTPEVVAQNDDVAAGNTDSRLTFTLTSTGIWTVGATSFLPDQTGTFTLTLRCSDAPAPTPTPTPGPTGPCLPDANTLCLNGGRFRVRMAWVAPSGQSGQGVAVPETSDTGMFWFFSANNIEAIVKVVDGCGFNQRFWVFAGGLTNVETTTTVTDTQTGQVRTYVNAQGSAFAPIQDTAAFATCP